INPSRSTPPSPIRAVVPHPRHVLVEWIHAVAGDHEAVVQELPRHLLQRLDQFGEPEVDVVVRLDHEVLRRPVPVEQLREAGKIRVGLALVHVLGAVEDDDVVVAHDLHGHQHPLLLLGQVAEDEADVDVGGEVGLERVNEAEEVAALVQVGAGEDAEEEAEVGFHRDGLGEADRNRGGGGAAGGDERLQLELLRVDDVVDEG
ncbi:unnamed protein product, partial [Musa acuminata subsp. malaccensis]